ncbi:SHLD2 protein, partial [Amia calva]|nr:SHLD2 protein [Amia calva]
LSPAAVREYLDSCFPSQGEGDSEAGRTMSVETEYLSVWTVSQALVLKAQLGTGRDVQRQQGREAATSKDMISVAQASKHPVSPGCSPELYSPCSNPNPTGDEATLTEEGSTELFDTLGKPQEEGGVVIEATSEGLLCSQGHCLPEGSKEVSKQPRPQCRSPGSPASKKSRASRAWGQREQTGTRGPCLPATLLTGCVPRGGRYRVLVCVLYPCHLKEIKAKSGTSAGSSVPLATIVVTDQSGMDMKVVLWRSAAFWALTVYPGDILFITDLTVHEDKWRGEWVLQSTYQTHLLNVGRVGETSRLQVPEAVAEGALEDLCRYLTHRHPLLLSLAPRAPQDPTDIPYARLGKLQPNTLVHALLRVTHTSLVTESEGSSRTGVGRKAVLVVEQGSQQGTLLLWGSAMAWLRNIHRNRGAVWEFRVLLVRGSVASGAMELHSTPWGWARPAPALGSLEIDLHTLLSQRHTGDVEVKGQVVALQFGNTQDTLLRMDSHTPLQRIVGAVTNDITFHGCGRCGSELGTDHNGIYRPCFPCLPYRGVRHYYRPALLTVRDVDSEICVQVPPVLVQKMLLNIPPELLSKTVVPSSDMTFGQVVVDLCHSLLSRPLDTYQLTLRSHFLLDENSVPIQQDFLLLDF